MLAKVGEGFAKVSYVVFALFASHDDIVDVRRDIPVQLSVKYCYNGSVARAPCVTKTLK